LKEVHAEVVRELTAADLVLLNGDRGVRPSRIQKLTDMHHSIARLVAQGETNYAIALATGYSESRISILKSDPAFQELVAAKREAVAEITERYAEAIQSKMMAMGMDGLEIMHEKMLEGELSDRDHAEATFKVLDRAGFGPMQKSQSTTLNLNDLAGQIAEGRQRAAELNAAVPAAQAGREIVPSLPSGRLPRIEAPADFRKPDIPPEGQE
jgi:hypothetical protein